MGVGPVLKNMGNAQARFEALVQAYAGDLYRFAFWLTRDRTRAEDLVQETMLRAWRGLSSLREDKAAKHWLITILRREFARGFERYRPVMEDLDLDTVVSDDQEQPLETLQMRQALATLSQEYSEPLLLQVLGGYSCAEIAQTLGISKQATMTRLFRARQKLRAVLSGHDNDEVNRELLR
jgi:RNA polymerase sigma-70 factor, ECF subfamily